MKFYFISLDCALRLIVTSCSDTMLIPFLKQFSKIYYTKECHYCNSAPGILSQLLGHVLLSEICNI